MSLFSKIAVYLGFGDEDDIYAERRAHERLKVSLQGEVEQGELKTGVRILDISQGGVRVEMVENMTFDLNQPLYLVGLIEDKMYRIQFQVVWNKEGRLGMRVVDWEEWLKYFFMLSKNAG